MMGSLLTLNSAELQLIVLDDRVEPPNIKLMFSSESTTAILYNFITLPVALQSWIMQDCTEYTANRAADFLALQHHVIRICVNDDETVPENVEFPSKLEEFCIVLVELFESSDTLSVLMRFCIRAKITNLSYECNDEFVNNLLTTLSLAHQMCFTN
ncbi:hypothetical protein GJ496_006299 [Pomphorhynchus laevis]|nr:hypothetical protein GJ496_006299 [Pomphorhynchus laevis]